MNKLIGLLTLCALAACGGGGGAGQAGDTTAANQAPAAPQPDVPLAMTATAGDIVLMLKRDVPVSTITGRYGLSVVDQFGKRSIWRLRAPLGANVELLLERVKSDGNVRFAERNFQSQTPEGRKNNVWAIGGEDAAAYGGQWAPAAIGLPAAHALSTGQGVRIAILDTGIDATHPALAARIERDANGAIVGRDFVDDDTDPSEAGTPGDLGYGHGTHVAGIVALTAPGATLLPARVLDAAGSGNIWVLSEAIGWAVDPDGDPTTDDGAHVINMSLGTLQQTNLLKTVTGLADCSFDDDDDDFKGDEFADDRARCALQYGAVVASAAGNGGSDSELQYPASEDVKGSMSVGASAGNGGRAPFSNFGSKVTVAAPGQSIISTIPGGGYATWSGTSMAAPFAAGTAALLIATLPQRQWNAEMVVKRLSDRSAPLCNESMRQIDADAVLRDVSPATVVCR